MDIHTAKKIIKQVTKKSQNEIVKANKTGYGFDFYTESYVDMIKNGIIDPAKVTRTALQNALSVASLILIT